MQKSSLNLIEDAIVDIRNGKPVIVMDDESRENEGDLIIAARHANAENMAFFIRYTSGVLCAPMRSERAKSLGLPSMVQKNQCPTGTAFTISCDSKDTTTGISARDRARTFIALASESTTSEDIIRPGHVFPLVARDGGVLERRGHTEATLNLCRLAGIYPEVGAIGELTNDNGTMMRLDDCLKFAQEHNLKIITVESLVKFIKNNPVDLKRKQATEQENVKRMKVEEKSAKSSVSLSCECIIPIERNGEYLGEWTLKLFHSDIESGFIVVLVKGQVEGCEGVITRVHSGCFTGNVVGSMRCDCNEQFTEALKKVHQKGQGVVLYIEGHEGRGIGLEAKIKAYQLQSQQKLDTYQANEALGYPADMRTYRSARDIIDYLGIKTIELLTHNAQKLAELEDLVVKVTPLSTSPNVHNKEYLEAKRKRENELLGGKLQSVQETSPSKIIDSLFPTPSYSAPNPLDQGGCSIEAKHAKEMPLLVPSNIEVEQLRIGVVHTLWNESLIKPMTDSAVRAMTDAGVSKRNIEIQCVPGSFELPYSCQLLAKSGKVDVVLALGVLIKGETAHFEYISSATAQGLMDVGLKTEVPILYGVLNCYTYQHAVDRCLPPSELPTSLGLSAIRMAALKRNMIRS